MSEKDAKNKSDLSASWVPGGFTYHTLVGSQIIFDEYYTNMILPRLVTTVHMIFF